MTTPNQLPYEPFPSFAQWQQVPGDSDTFERFSSLLDQTRNEASADDLVRAVRVATKQAAVDTGAIENLYDVNRGFTFTVATEAAAWDNMRDVVGTEAARAIAAALEAYDYVLDLATGSRPVTEQWIRQLHEIVCRSQDTFRVMTAAGPQDQELPKGQYKTQPNSPLNLGSGEIHSYAPPLDTPSEMARLVAEVTTNEFTEAHPVVQASYAHYAFVCVHPFADGNGRVARALASIYLYRRPGVPLVIFADEKGGYLDALENADRGNHSAFIQFIADRVVDTIQMVRATLRRSTADVATSLAGFGEALTGRGGLAHEEIDAIAGQLTEAFDTAASKVAGEVAVTQPLSIGAGRLGLSATEPPPPGYRNPPLELQIQLGASTSGPGQARSDRRYRTVVGKAGTDVDDFAIVRNDGTVIETILLREVYPALSSSLRYRLQLAAEAEFDELMAQVASATAENLQRLGYR